MWNTWFPFQKNKGYLLLELIIGISISMILITSLYSMLDFSISSTALGESMDEVLLNGRYGIEYIKEEIAYADVIICSSKIKNLNLLYPNNIGFVIMQDLKNYIPKAYESSEDYKYRYRFITYYLTGNRIQRMSCNKDSATYPELKYLTGHNVVCESVLSINQSNVDFKNKLINLSLSVGVDNKEIHNFKSTAYINCNIDNN